VVRGCFQTTPKKTNDERIGEIVANNLYISNNQLDKGELENYNKPKYMKVKLY
jgi:hypothetical protein